MNHVFGHPGNLLMTIPRGSRACSKYIYGISSLFSFQFSLSMSFLSYKWISRFISEGNKPKNEVTKEQHITWHRIMCGWGGPDAPILLRWHLEENIWACCICSGYVSWLQQRRQSKALCSMTDLKSGSSISAQQQKIQFSPKRSNSKHNLNSVIFLTGVAPLLLNSHSHCPLLKAWST